MKTRLSTLKIYGPLSIPQSRHLSTLHLDTVVVAKAHQVYPILNLQETGLTLARFERNRYNMGISREQYRVPDNSEAKD